MALPRFLSVINSASRIGCITSKIDNRQVLHMGQGMITFPGVCPLALCRSCYQCFFFIYFIVFIVFPLTGWSSAIGVFIFLCSLDMWKFEFHYRLHVLVNISGQSTRKNLHYIFQVKIATFICFSNIYTMYLYFFLF